MAELWVDTERLAAATPGITELSDRLAGVVADLVGTIDSVGPCWGEDAYGTAFLDQYDGPKTTLLRGLDSTREVLASTAAGVVTMVKGFTATEEGNTIPRSGFTGPDIPDEPHTD